MLSAAMSRLSNTPRSFITMCWRRAAVAGFLLLPSASCTDEDREHLKAILTSDHTYFGTEHDAFRWDILYKAPDSWSASCQGCGSTFGDMIVIGDQAWERRGGSWTETDPADVRVIARLLVEPAQVLARSSSLETAGDGPVIQGERTFGCISAIQARGTT